MQGRRSFCVPGRAALERQRGKPSDSKRTQRHWLAHLVQCQSTMPFESGAPRQHPILPTEVIDLDGKHRHGLRVFCDTRQRSVPLDICRECPSCARITDSEGGRGGSVDCTPPLELVPDAPVAAGAALRRGVVAVDAAVLVRDVVALFVERGLRLVVVTGDAGRAEGIVHESQLLREIQDQARSLPTRLGWGLTAFESASAIMFPATTILEHAPLRAAVAAMATGHQRQLLVVDADGFPVGVLVDVDALHALHGRRD